MAYNKLQKLQDNINAVKIAAEIEQKSSKPTVKEQELLRRYSGFGGLKFILYPEGNQDAWRSSDKPYYDLTQQLFLLLKDITHDDSEYQSYLDSVRRSIISGFYTPQPIVNAIAESFHRNNIAFNSFLDPSAGKGIFLDIFRQYNPDMRSTAFEKDIITGKVLSALHKDTDVHVAGFETIDSSFNGTFDVVSSNIPFGDISVFDPLVLGKDVPEALKIAKKSIHNYFFMKSLYEVRDGGIVAFITSRGVMDSKRNEPVRRTLAESCNIISAVRLPDRMFRDESGTDVGSDLIILQKNENKKHLSPEDELFIKAEEHNVSVESAKTYTINDIFLDNDNYIADNVIIATDPYGKPALVYEYNGTSESIAERLSSKLDKSIGFNLDFELYNKGLNKSSIQKPTVKIVKTESDTTNVQLSLFDLWESDNAPTMEPRRYEGTMLPFYRDGIFIVDEDQLGVLSDCRHSPLFTPKQLSQDQSERLRQYILIRDAYDDLFSSETADRRVYPALRYKLNQYYDDFVKRFGYLNSKRNVRIIIMDALGRDTLTLENAASDGKTFVKSDIFDHPVSFSIDGTAHADTPEEALSASLNQSGTVDFDYMASVSNHTVSELRDALRERVYYNPIERTYEISDRFLSGNVIEKIEEIKSCEPSTPEEGQEIHRSLEALESVKPTPIPYEDLDFNFGERWMPISYFSEFASQFLDSEITIDYAPQMDEFVVSADGYSNKIRDEYSVTGEAKVYDGLDLLRHALYNTVPTIQRCIGYKPDGTAIMGPDHEKIQLAASKIDQIRDGFNEWISNHSSEWKAELADTYNRKFNCFVRANYDGSHQTFPGLDLKTLAASKYGISDVYKSQKDCVWMILQNGGGICDHEVGTGKTLIMCMAAHEMKRLNLAHKPIIIGMKANVSEIAATYQTAYPNDRILFASKKDFSDRQNFFNRMKNNDYDCIIMSHDQFTLIPQSPDIQHQVIEEEIYALDEALEVYQKKGYNVSGRMLSGLEKRKENLLVQLNSLNYKLSVRSDDVVDFKTMGIDHIFIDESQVFKNLAFTTRDSRVAGLGDPKGSQRSRNLQYAIRTIQERTGRDLGATFLSGTTISNSLTELYLLFKYLRPKALSHQNINSFDAWAAVFARKSRDYEINVAGSVVMKERFRHFIKVPELAAFYNEITDYRTANDVGLDRPDMSVKLVNIAPTDDHKDFSQRLLKFAESGDGSLVFRPALSNSEQTAKMLLVTNMGKKCSLSPKLVNPDYQEGDNTKIGVAAKNISEYYYRYNEHKGTQFVFCDLSTPHVGEWTVYQELKDRLVNEYGIPSEEIGFIQDASTEKKKSEYISRMNDGDIRIMIGSTTMLGTGVNAQKRAVAVHHLDLPWRPSDLEQRNGRARRKGNEVARLYADNNVDVLVYAVERSLDSYNFYLLQAKSEFIRQMKMGSLAKRSFDQGGDDEQNGMPFAEYVAITSGNNDLLERAKLEKRILGLESEKKAFVSEQYRTAFRLSNARTDLENSKVTLQYLKEDLERLKISAEKDADGNFINRLEINGSKYFTEEEKGTYMQEQMKRIVPEERQIASIYGFPVIVRPIPTLDGGKTNICVVKGSYTYTSGQGHVNLSSRRAAASYAINALSRIPSLVSQYEKSVSDFEKEIPELERISSKTWEKAELLKSLKDELQILDRKIQQDMDASNLQSLHNGAESAPLFSIEHHNWGRKPWELTFSMKDYPYLSQDDLDVIAQKYQGDIRFSETDVRGDFRHKYGAEEAIRELSKLNAEHMKDREWLIKSAQNIYDHACIPCIVKLREYGLDRYGNTLDYNISRNMNVYALADYESVRELCHRVKSGSEIAIKAASSAMASAIQSLPDTSNCVLVAMPGHRGIGGPTAKLADMISAKTGIPAVPFLQSAPHAELYSWKKEHPNEPLPTLYFAQNEDMRPQFDGKTPIVIDNVLDTGTTANAASEAFKNDAIMVVLGTTGNHREYNGTLNVSIVPDGLQSIEAARPEGVGFTGKSQNEINELLDFARDSGLRQSIFARSDLRRIGIDWHTGLPLHLVNHIVKKWQENPDGINQSVKTLQSFQQSGNLFTKEQMQFISQQDQKTITGLLDKIDTSGSHVADYFEKRDLSSRLLITYDYLMEKAASKAKSLTIAVSDEEKSIIAKLYESGSDEIRTIIDSARDAGNLLMAPDGTKTLLSPIQWVYIHTQQFREHFGESKIVSSNGEPQLLYHGTLHHDFDTFRNEGHGIYFTPSLDAASTYGGNDAKPYMVFVNLRSPLQLDFNGDSDTEETDEHYSLEDEYLYTTKTYDYDGVYATNTSDGQNVFDQIVVQRPEDIMLADDLHLLRQMNMAEEHSSVRMMKGSFAIGKDVIGYSMYKEEGEVGIPNAYVVDFGIRNDITKYVSVSELEDLASAQNGYVAVYKLQNNRIEGYDFISEDEAERFASSVQELVNLRKSIRQRKLEDSIRDSLVDRMQSSGLSVNMNLDDARKVLSETSGIDLDNPSLPLFKTSHGDSIYGFVYNGTMYIDPTIATSETPIHEYTHMWAEGIRQSNPDTWNEIVEKTKGVTELWNKVKEHYPELETDDAIADEVLAQYSGSRGHERLLAAASGLSDNPDGIIDRIQSVLEKFWSAVAEMLHIHRDTKDNSISVNDITELADRILSDLLSGYNPIAKDIRMHREAMDSDIKMHRSTDLSGNRYRIVQNEYYQDGTPFPDDYSVDFGMNQDLLQFVTLNEIQDLASIHGGTADYVRHHADRIEGKDFWNGVVAREFADEVLNLVDDRKRHFENGLITSLVGIMRNAGINVVTDDSMVQAILSDMQTRKEPSAIADSSMTSAIGERSDVIPGSNIHPMPTIRGQRTPKPLVTTRSLTPQIDVANLRKNTELTKQKIRNSINNGDLTPKNLPADAVRVVSEALGIKKSTSGSKSSYTFYRDVYEGDYDIDGRTARIRISTHPANGTRLQSAPTDDRISLVIYKNGYPTGGGNYTEMTFYPDRVSPREAANIIRDIVSRLINDGEILDISGKAEVKEHVIGTSHVKSEAFKEWFGDWENDRENASKVIDSEGQPLVVYHGSPRWFTVPNLNPETHAHNVNSPEGTMYFTSSRENASTYAMGIKTDVQLDENRLGTISQMDRDGNWHDNKDYRGGIYPVFLDIRNPFVVDFEGTPWHGTAEGKAELFVKDKNGEFNISVKSDDGHRFFGSHEEAENYAVKKGISDYWIQDDPFIGFDSNEVVDKARSEGCDGVILRNIEDHASSENSLISNTYIVFDASQVKSATHNTGLYDRNNPDIRFFKTAEGGEVYGFVHNGTIYLDDSIGTSETPIHEYTHLWAEILRQQNPEEWKNVVSLMKDAAELWSMVQRDYPELETDDAIADEVLAQYSGSRGHERLLAASIESKEPDNIIAKVSHALDKLWSFVADFLHVHYVSKEQIADQVLRDMLNGVNPLNTGIDYVKELSNKVDILDILSKDKSLWSDELYEALPDNLKVLYSKSESSAEQYDAVRISSLVSPSDRNDILLRARSNSKDYISALHQYLGISSTIDISSRKQELERELKPLVAIRPIYTGFFIQDIESLKKKYPPVFENEYYHHITDQYRPDMVDVLSLGTAGTALITGRITTDKVDVLLVDEWINSENILKDLKCSSPTPHITLSTAGGIAPKECNAIIARYRELCVELSNSESLLEYATWDSSESSGDVIMDLQTDILKMEEELKQYKFTPLSDNIEVRHGVFIDGKVAYGIDSRNISEEISLRLHKATVNKVSWSGTLNVYSSSSYLPVRVLSHGVKSGNEEAIEEASVILATLVQRIPNHRNSVLVPMPNRSGNAGYTLDLANRIGKELNLPVCDVLTGKPHKTMFSRKEDRGNEGLRLMRFDTKAAVPQGKSVILVDNVLDTGTTAMSAMRTLGGNTSLVVLGNTNNYQKYNYPITVSQNPTLSVNFSVRKSAEIVHQLKSAYDLYYKSKSLNPDIIDSILKKSHIRNWSDVSSTAELLSHSANSSSEHAKSMSDYIYRLDASNRLCSDYLQMHGKNSAKLPARDMDGRPLLLHFTADGLNYEYPNVLYANISKLPNDRYNNLVNQILAVIKLNSICQYVKSDPSKHHILRLPQIEIASDGKANTINACRIYINEFDIKFAHTFSNALTEQGLVALSALAVTDRNKLINSVIEQLGVPKQDICYSDNYLIIPNNNNVEPLKQEPMSKQSTTELNDNKVDGQQEKSEQTEVKHNTQSKNSWANYDYSKNKLPEGVTVEKAKVTKLKEGENAGKWVLSADINGEHKQVLLYKNDLDAFFERDAENALTRRVTPNMLVAKYFKKQYADWNNDKASSEDKVKEPGNTHHETDSKQATKFLGSYDIPIYAVAYFANGTDGLDGLSEEDVKNIIDFEQSLPKPYIINFPDDVDAAKNFTESPAFGTATEAVKAEVFQVVEKANEKEEIKMTNAVQEQQEQDAKEKEAKEAAEEKAREEKSQEETMEEPAFQTKLLVYATLCAETQNRIWLNGSGKMGAELDSKRMAISPFNALMMSLHSDLMGYKTNVYTTFSEAKKNGYTVRSGQASLPFNYYMLDNYVNKYNDTDVIDKKTYDSLPPEEQEIYKPNMEKQVHHVFNIDQTLMKQLKPEMYDFYLQAQDHDAIKQDPSLVENTEHQIYNQFMDLKKKHPDALLLFRCGDFYETYMQDAEKSSKILGITLTKSSKTKDPDGKPLAMAGFPYHALDTYLPKLIRAGQRVAICDQIDAPKQTAKRGISDMVTPGASVEKEQKAQQKEDQAQGYHR